MMLGVAAELGFITGCVWTSAWWIFDYRRVCRQRDQLLDAIKDSIKAGAQISSAIVTAHKIHIGETEVELRSLH